jgi:hypothetical protein
MFVRLDVSDVNSLFGLSLSQFILQPIGQNRCVAPQYLVIDSLRTKTFELKPSHILQYIPNNSITAGRILSKVLGLFDTELGQDVDGCWIRHVENVRYAKESVGLMTVLLKKGL